MTDKLLWLDMEMTGLDPETDEITEIAAIVTDYEFNELGRFEVVIKISEQSIERMKSQKWYEVEDGKKILKGTVYDMALSNNLIARANEEGVGLAEAEQKFVDFIKNNFGEDAVIAGNSIHQDRRFIRKYLKNVEELLHYRMLDVTSFKLIAQNKYKLEYSSQKTHQALDDIIDSVNELTFYLENLTTVNRK